MAAVSPLEPGDLNGSTDFGSEGGFRDLGSGIRDQSLFLTQQRLSKIRALYVDEKNDCNTFTMHVYRSSIESPFSKK